MKNITNFDLNELKFFNKIFCLVSGGIDSTYLYELIYEKYPIQTYAVNCFNPYEQSNTLNQFKLLKNFIEIKPIWDCNYSEILKSSFKLIPKAIEARKKHKYEKKIFPCCKLIKHEAFKIHPLFLEKNTVVISGIKAGDGKIRRWFLKDLRQGNQANYSEKMIKGFFHKHKEGQLYCYPFRDYYKRELPKSILKELRNKYPNLDHSGCSICPVLVVFNDKIKSKNTDRSIKYWHKMNGGKFIKDYVDKMGYGVDI